MLTRSIGGDASSVKRNGGGQGEFFGLREWQSGDSTQLIHWRTTARTGVPAVRQFEQKRSFDVCLLLDTWRGDSGNDSIDEDAAFERAVSLAASFLCRLQQVATNRFVLAVASPEASVVQNEGRRGGGDLAMSRMLRLLAAVKPTSSPDLSKAIGATLQAVGRTQDMIVISTRSMNEAIVSDGDLKSGDLKNAVSTWNRTGMLRWVNVQSSDFDQFVSSGRSSKSHQGVAS